MHSDLLRRAIPRSATTCGEYVDPARYRVVVTDRAGTPFFEAIGGDKRVTMRLRTLRRTSSCRLGAR